MHQALENLNNDALYINICELLKKSPSKEKNQESINRSIYDVRKVLCSKIQTYIKSCWKWEKF